MMNDEFLKILILNLFTKLKIIKFKN